MGDEADPTPLDDLSAADWLVAAVPEFHGRVRDVATDLFPAFARIFHRPDQGLADDSEPATWAEVAENVGTVFHRAAQFADLAFPPGHSREAQAFQPLFGSLDPVTLPLVRDLLAECTATPERCFFALWDGFGDAPPEWFHRPVFRLPGRHYWLFRGALAEVVEVSVEFDNAGRGEAGASFRELGLLRSPTLWWPEDRSWLVHSEIDYDSTIVGGPVDLIHALVDHPKIEALQVDRDMSLYFNADTVNGSTQTGSH